MIFRHGSNELDTFVLVPGKHCQAGLPLFEPCLKKFIEGIGNPIGGRSIGGCARSIGAYGQCRARLIVATADLSASIRINLRRGPRIP